MPQLDAALNDFSLGEVDITAKRSDGPVARTGARQMSNFRILNTHKMANRPGRSALFSELGRVEEITMAPGSNFFLVFGAGYLRVYDTTGNRVFSTTVKGDGSTAIPWASPYGGISYAIINLSIYIFYSAGAPNNVPQILSWDGASTWTLSTWAETITTSGQKRTLFYRISPQSITLQPSGTTGTVNLTFSANVLVAGMVGTRILYCGRQLTIATVTNGTTGTATCNEQLPQGQVIGFAADPSSNFKIGDEVLGSISQAVGLVTVVSASPAQITVQILPSGTGATVGFTSTDIITGPNGFQTANALSNTTPQAVSVWQDEVMNTYRGYPVSVTYDQTRLILCNILSVREGIAWSAIALPNDFYAEVAQPENAIFELGPDKCQMLYVVGGMEGSEFFFADNAIYYTVINVTNPLKPGSVAFNKLSAWGCMPNVQPRSAEQSIVYMKAGGLQVGAVQVPGAYYRPYIIDSISEFHSHLFTASSPVAIAIPSASAQFEELYCHIAMSDGSMVVGKYSMRQGLIEPGEDGKPKVGWSPWNGVGTVNWVAALNSNVVFASLYDNGGFGAVELLDNTKYLDCSLFVNNLPTSFTPPSGKGPLWFIPGGTAFLIDNGTRFMGTYNIDANGWIIPQNQGGENLASANLIAGQPWTATYEPFIPHAPSGQNEHQRMRKRRIPRAAASVQNSSGFVLGTRRIPAYFVGDNATQPAPLREDTYFTRPHGSAYDPRIALVKDTPGPLTLLEFGVEATV